MTRYVFAQVDDAGAVIRIFKSRKRAREVNPESVVVMVHGAAVASIRRAVYQRQDGRCRKCPNLITWDSMHLDERQARGEFDADGHSGEVSTSNCQGLCADCHVLGPRSEHGNRRPRFGEKETR